MAELEYSSRDRWSGIVRVAHSELREDSRNCASGKAEIHPLLLPVCVFAERFLGKQSGSLEGGIVHFSHAEIRILLLLGRLKNVSRYRLLQTVAALNGILPGLISKSAGKERQPSHCVAQEAE